ncbi:MAG: histidine phosphatase family protein [Desulfobacteraceae bacterium]|jgi:phosphohistidine phosphatase
MKTLTLIRHAKSSWKYPDLADYDRPLNKRGRRDAAMMAERLNVRGFSPQRILTSPAVRALRTAEAMAAAIDLSTQQIEITPLIYGGGVQDLLQLIREQAPDESWIALVGHNPEFTILARLLSGRSIENVPTCGVVESQFETDRWQQVGADGATASRFCFDFPKKQAS